VRFALKFAALLGIALTVFNGQCIANCLVTPCQSQHDSGLPPCHRHAPPDSHPQHDSHSCAQPAAFDHSTPAAPALIPALSATPVVAPAIQTGLRASPFTDRSLPNSPPPPLLPLRI
jgi:hypothetical protein